MAIFFAGLVIFLGVHSISIVNVTWRNNMSDKIGDGAWRGLYSLVAIIGFILLIWGYAMARHDSLIIYNPPALLQHLSFILLLPVFPLLIATYFPGRIKAAVKHPMLLAIKIWASAHLLANGELINVILFGSFLCWAVIDRISLKNRPQRAIPGAPPSPLNDTLGTILQRNSVDYSPAQKRAEQYHIDELSIGQQMS